LFIYQGSTHEAMHDAGAAYASARQRGAGQAASDRLYRTPHTAARIDARPVHRRACMHTSVTTSKSATGDATPITRRCGVDSATRPHWAVRWQRTNLSLHCIHCIVTPIPVLPFIEQLTPALNNDLGYLGQLHAIRCHSSIASRCDVVLKPVGANATLRFSLQ
jgi:hypothetical protein